MINALRPHGRSDHGSMLFGHRLHAHAPRPEMGAQDASYVRFARVAALHRTSCEQQPFEALMRISPAGNGEPIIVVQATSMDSFST
jgi:hypothetical protein